MEQAEQGERCGNSNVEKWIEDATILKVLTGSRGYGVVTENSDHDVIGVAIPPKELLLGLQGFKHYNAAEYKDGAINNPRNKTEVTIFSLLRFFDLAIGMKSHALEVLFAHPDNILKCAPFGSILLENKHLFLSKKVYFSLRSHAFSEERSIRNTLRSYNTDFYMKRNKHYYLMFALLHIGIETLETGEVNIRRDKEKEFLLDVREGRISEEEMDKVKSKLFRRLDDANTSSKLPDFVDYNKVNDLLVEMTSASIFLGPKPSLTFLRALKNTINQMYSLSS